MATNRRTLAAALTGTQLIGLGSIDALTTAARVRRGFPFTSVTRLEKASGLSREKLGTFTAIPPRTLTRRQSEGQLQPDESDRVLRAARVFEMALALFEKDAAAARRWLQTPQEALGGEVPLELAATDVGAPEVEALIGRLEEGVLV